MLRSLDVRGNHLLIVKSLELLRGLPYLSNLKLSSPDQVGPILVTPEDIVNLQPSRPALNVEYGRNPLSTMLSAVNDVERSGNYSWTKRCLEHLVNLHPKNADARNAYAWFLSTCPESKFRSGARASKLALKAVQLSRFQNANFLDTFAAALAETVGFRKTQQVQTQAIDLVPYHRRGPFIDAREGYLSRQTHVRRLNALEE